MSKFRTFLLTLVVASAAVLATSTGVATAANENGNGKGNGGASGQAQNARGPSAQATYGLCNASLHGQGGAKGKKAKARAVRALQQANGLATADAVKSFCQDFVANHAPAKDEDAKDDAKTG